LRIADNQVRSQRMKTFRNRLYFSWHFNLLLFEDWIWKLGWRESQTRQNNTVCAPTPRTGGPLQARLRPPLQSMNGDHGAAPGLHALRRVQHEVCGRTDHALVVAELVHGALHLGMVVHKLADFF